MLYGKVMILKAEELKTQKNGVTQGFWSCQEGVCSWIKQGSLGIYLEKVCKLRVTVRLCSSKWKEIDTAGYGLERRKFTVLRLRGRGGKSQLQTLIKHLLCARLCSKY